MNRRRTNGMMWMALVVAIGVAWAAVSQSGPRDAAAQAHRQSGGGQDPQQEAARGGMDMMMESPRMIRMMERMHAGDDSAWEASEAGIFVVRGTRLLRYDADSLELLAEAELPDRQSPPLGIEREEEQADPQRGGAMRQGMQRMMRQAQASLRPDVRVVGPSVYVTRGDQLLRYDRDLELQESADLPEATMMHEGPTERDEQ